MLYYSPSACVTRILTIQLGVHWVHGVCGQDVQAIHDAFKGAMDSMPEITIFDR